MTSQTEFLRVLKPQEIEILREARPRGKRPHPVVHLYRARADDPVTLNTQIAAEEVYFKDEKWLTGLRDRLLTSDLTGVSSALGELRAYGTLLKTGVTVKPKATIPGSTSSPDFEADAGDGVVVVEVHSRQLDTAKSVRSFPIQHTKGIISQETEIAQFGLPEPGKAGESVLANAISKIAATKQGEHQIDESKPFVLWLDLQDRTVWPFPIDEQHFSALYTESFGRVRSGAAWYALYGVKGEPIFDETCGPDYCAAKMLHDGRFVSGKKVSAFVFSLPNATVLMENPQAAKPLPSRFRVALLRAPHFRLDLSVCEWETGVISTQLNFVRMITSTAAKALEASNPP